MSELSEQREPLSTSPKKGASWRLLILIGVALGAAWAAYYFLYASRTSTLDAFAKCTSANGTRMYGAWWCPHCAEQKETFGYAFRYVSYTECSPQGQRTLTDECKQAGIKHFPTWQFRDGSREEGTLPLTTLAERTGCKLP